MNNIKNTQIRDKTSSIISTVHSQSDSRAEINMLHSQFTEYGKNAKLWMRKCVLLLPEITRNRVWEKKKFGSIYEYAAKLAGMSERTVDESLRVLEKIKDKPELIKIAGEKGITAIRPVATIATKETEKFWAKKANEMSQHTLEVYVKEYRGISLRAERLDSEKRIVAMALDAEVIAKLEKMKGENDWNDLMKKLIKEHEEKLELEKPKAVEAASRHIPAKIKKFIAERSANTCEYPGCTKKTAILHHTDRFAISQTHDPDKIRALCKEHEHLAHYGLIENEEKSPNTWQIKKYAYGDDQKYAKGNRRFYEFMTKSKIDSIVMKKRRFP